MSSPIEQPEQRAEYYADDNAGNHGKIEIPGENIETGQRRYDVTRSPIDDLCHRKNDVRACSILPKYTSPAPRECYGVTQSLIPHGARLK